MKRPTISRQRLIGSAAGNVTTRTAGAALAVVVAMAAFTTVARADDLDFAKSKKCMNCHAVDQKLVGPAFKAVATRYANDREAEARLAKKIREGGAGAWGVVPMPANTEVNAADAQRLAHWVLMQK